MWYASNVKCRICNTTHIAVYEDDTDEDNLQCPTCDHMTCEPIEMYTIEVQFREDEEE